MWRYPLGPPIHQLLRTISLLGRWSSTGSDRASHISSWLQEIQSREWEERTKNKRTIWTWVNSKCKKRSYVTLCIPLCICRLTLARISSEIFTKLLGIPTHLDRSSITGLSHADWSLLQSGVDLSATLRRSSLTDFLEFLCPTPLAFPYPLPVTSRSRAQAFV